MCPYGLRRMFLVSSTFSCFHSNHTSMYSEGHVPYRDHVKKNVIGHKVHSRPLWGYLIPRVIPHFLSIKKKNFHHGQYECIHSHNRNRLYSAIYAPGVTREEESQGNAETCSPRTESTVIPRCLCGIASCSLPLCRLSSSSHNVV